jgi:hypothetical protein
MLAELVFVTRLLGLMTGTRVVEAQVDPAVQWVELLLDGQSAEVLRGQPWRTKIDFGAELAPHVLTAIARDGEGRELARDTQFINVPRPQAEIGVMFRRGRADITWQHIGGMKPKKMMVKLNQTTTLASTLTRSVALPPLIPEMLNLLSIDLEFEDGSSAHRDVVFGGQSEEVPAELTATLVRQRGKGQDDRANCFQVGGRTIAASEVETGQAAVLVVRNGAAPIAQFRRRNLNRARMAENVFMVKQTSVRFIWPTASGAGNSDLFMTSDNVEATRGLRFLLTEAEGSKGMTVRLADAVAVAGTEALREPRRRAVILVLNGEEDKSRYHADTVRRYLQRLGVPLYVWSLTGATTHPAWGKLEDVSTNERMRDAVKRLQHDLDQQRVAWLPADPYQALHVETTAECAWEPLAAR